MKHYVLFIIIAICPAIRSMAQADSHLAKLANDIISLQRKTSNKARLNQLVLNWSESSMPKITLMDDIGRAANEYRGADANRFKMNQLVTFVYDRQNKGMVSKGDYFNSTEQGVHYSAIEKTVSKGKTVTYTLTGHSGLQEFLFIPFNPNALFTATVNGEKAKKKENGVQYISLPNITKQDTITFTITYDNNNAAAFESFVIVNYNPQK